MGAKTRTRRDWVWVGRDNGFKCSFCHICAAKQRPTPVRSEMFPAKFYWQSPSGIDICDQWLHRATGITLQPGELRKVRFTAEVIE